MSFFGDFGRRVLEARQRQADAYVNSLLNGYDEKTLRQAGLEHRKGSASAKGGILL